jgi:hypothetical protein
MFRQLLLATLLSSSLWAQSSPAPANPQDSSQSPPPSSAQAQPPANPGDLAQMRRDLDLMDSMLNNMNSEITFLRDQNLQILLNTNSRMWAMLIRDLRLQLNREEQRPTRAPEPPAATRPGSDNSPTGKKPK